MTRFHWLVLCLLPVVALLGCPEDEGDDDTADDDTADDDTADDDDPGDWIAQVCGDQEWDAELVEATVGELTGSYSTYYSTNVLPVGSVESMKLIPDHPFWVTTIRAAYASGSGAARVRLTYSWGRSYPDVEDEAGGDVTEPLEFEVEDADPDEWIEIDVADRGILLKPTEHYHLADERLEDGPMLALETVPEGETSRALMLVPGEEMPYGDERNFRLEMSGYYFCSWDDADFWFAEDASQPWDEGASSRVAVTDLDGDGHDDVVLQAGGPVAYLGDGTGNFEVPATDPFPGAEDAGMLIFGDLDNDGDVDAFASVYVGADDDGDGQTKEEGDCNDADADIRPTADELVANYIDDNCDGIADDGTDTLDRDADGYSIADGDCNDLDPEVFPGSPEITNGKDDDCDGIADDGTDESDADGDWVSIAWGDCDDTNPDVPNPTDGWDNGIDDDCDGVVDSGTSTADADGDGYSVVDGDCDDSRAELFPGNPEERDGMDNDCDGVVDEDWGNFVMLNDGSGQFTILDLTGVGYVDPSTAGGFGDADADGWLDLYYGNWLEQYPYDPAVPDHFFWGNGDGSFVEALAEAGMEMSAPLSVYGVMWNDFDNDGWQDVFVGNYHLYANQMWNNQGDGTFVDVAEDIGVAFDDIAGPYSSMPGGHTYGGDFGDVDNDGDMDFFVCNLAHPRVQPWSDPSMFVINSGDPDYLYENLLYDYGFIYDEGDVNAEFGDYDNDMDVDLAIGTLYSGHYSKLYRNDGAYGFTDVSYHTQTAVHESVSVVWSDVDEDGDLDLFVADRSGSPYIHLFVNHVGTLNNFVELDLEGTTTNRDAIGARVTLTAGGVTQMRDVQGGGGHSNTQHSRIVHFGLAQNTTIDEVTVRWVGGDTETITGIEPNHRYSVVEGTGAGEVIW